MSFFDVTNGPRAGSKLVFLQGLTPKEWSKVFTFAEMRKFSTGDVLVSAGDEDDSFYIMTAGSAEVLQGAKIIGRIAEGSVFGEVAFFDRQPRSASIRALELGSAARFSRSAFENLAAWEPVLARRMLYELGNALALRLRTAEQRLGGS
jgi:CRP-like cAMP-binding protein